jgi:hypothetical protein
LKSWQLNRKVNGLSDRIDESTKTDTRFDINSFCEPERKLLDKVQEIVDKYAPAVNAAGDPDDAFIQVVVDAVDQNGAQLSGAMVNQWVGTTGNVPYTSTIANGGSYVVEINCGNLIWRQNIYGVYKDTTYTMETLTGQVKTHLAGARLTLSSKLLQLLQARSQPLLVTSLLVH